MFTIHKLFFFSLSLVNTITNFQKQLHEKKANFQRSFVFYFYFLFVGYFFLLVLFFVYFYVQNCVCFCNTYVCIDKYFLEKDKKRDLNLFQIITTINKHYSSYKLEKRKKGNKFYWILYTYKNS